MEVTLHPRAEEEVAIEDDPDFAAIVKESQSSASAFRPISARGAGSAEWDAPLDLRVNSPFAVDLMRLWELTGQAVPPSIAAALGHRIPVLIHHIVTPFPNDGNVPGGVWGLGYEFVNDSADANTVAVMPSDEVLKIGSIGQDVEIGLDLSGGVGLPEAALEAVSSVPGVQLSGAEITAAANSKFQFSLKLSLSLRKVVGAPVGKGGALWKMYRQDEPLDRSHTLLQTLMVSEGTKELSCTVKTWAKQAGFLGTRLGAKFWSYQDETFLINLEASPGS